MEKKKLNIILIFIAILIWGALFYKFITRHFNNPEQLTATNDPIKKRTPLKTVKDTLILTFPPRDPFLDKISRTSKSSPIKPPVKNYKPKKPAIPAQWPEIKYLGFVKSKSNNNPLALIRINGKLHRVHQNANINGIKVNQINSDLIQLSNGKERRNFKKK